MRRADLTYAPSRYLAEHFRQKYKIDVGVNRPPAYFEASERGAIPFPLPERFFLHFGLLLNRKGTGLVAEALPLAWKIVPDLKMIWSGRCSDENQLQGWRSLWGDRKHQVLVTGPLCRQQIQRVLMQADAAVLPSLVDNLPDRSLKACYWVFQCCIAGSIDEIVEEGRSGHLVDLGDVHGLADAMIKMWRGESPVVKGFKWDLNIAKEMQPHHEVAKIIELGEPKISLKHRGAM